MPETARDYSTQDGRLGLQVARASACSDSSARIRGFDSGARTDVLPVLVVTVPPVAFLMRAGPAEPAVAPVTVRLSERYVTEVAPTSRARSLTRERPRRFLAGSGSAPKRSTSSSARSSTSAREPRPEALR